MKKMKEVSFNLRDWISNDHEFLKHCNLPPVTEENSKTTILGLIWDVLRDSLTIKLTPFDPNTRIITKRIALQFYASVYDPLGLYSPCLLKLKLFLQDCWVNKFDWDTPLPTDFVVRFHKLARAISSLANESIPRRYWQHPNEGCTVTLHVFCDASKDAYACCAYLASHKPNSSIRASALIYSKVRAAPVNQRVKDIPTDTSEKGEQPKSIPKLELLGVLIGSRAATHLRSEIKLHIEDVVVWTDATTIIQWPSSASVLPIFVQNRIKEIRERPGLTFRHFQSQDNPADLATRGALPSSLQQDKLWWEGPKWLNHKDSWPEMPSNTDIFSTPSLTLLILEASYAGILTDKLEKRFGSWENYIRFFTYWHRLRCKWKPNLYPRPEYEYEHAEKVLIKELQKKYFSDHIHKLRSEKLVQANPQTEYFLDDDEIIRCRGRLMNASLGWDPTHPILLPRDSPVTVAYVLDLHKSMHHVGVNHLLTKLRERFWIIKGRAKIKSIIHRCVVCRRWEGGNYQLPPMPPLPLQRVAVASPFRFTGVDYLGPVKVLRNGISTDMYVALFVCLVTRAVHLELTRNQSGDEFLHALTRFTSRRGCPNYMISDNAKNFEFVQPLVSTLAPTDENDLRVRHRGVVDFLNTSRTYWKFIPPHSPWQGGAYERLVAIVKRCIKKSYGTRFLDEVEFITALSSIENTINDRPLTYVSVDEINNPLTPNTFLRPGHDNRYHSQLEITAKPLKSTTEKLITASRAVIALLEGFWDNFRTKYLTSLQERHTVGHPTKKNSLAYTPCIGEIVLMLEASPRASWKVGVIENLDIRQAVAHVKSNGHTYLRSINHLCPLELPQAVMPTPKQTEKPVKPNQTTESPLTIRRPKMRRTY